MPSSLTETAVLSEAALSADAEIRLGSIRGPEADLDAATAMQDSLGSRPYVHTGGV